MNRQELISRLDDGIAALRDLESRPFHSDRLIRIGTQFYSREDLCALLDAMENLSFNVGDEE